MNRQQLCYSLQLAKAPLCLMVALSAVFGYLLFLPKVSWTLLATGTGVFFLACGAASLNSLQEQESDALLSRTSNRPLPRQQLSRRYCAAQSFLLVVTGAMLLFNENTSNLPLLLGMANIILYNFIYTPLKFRSTLAIIPGAFSGAVPPLMGWLAAGGTPGAPILLLTMVTFLLWQIPHFWLVLLHHKEDYLHTALPNLLNQFSESRLRRILLVWVMAYASISLLYGIHPDLQRSHLYWFLIANLGSMILLFCYQLILCRDCDYRLLFHGFNLSLLTTMLIVTLARCNLLLFPAT